MNNNPSKPSTSLASHKQKASSSASQSRVSRSAPTSGLSTSRMHRHPQRRARRSRAYQAPSVALPSMPPTLSINANVGRHWIRNYITVDSNINFVDNLGSDILFADTNYSSVYGEYRIRRVNVWYIPQSAVVTTPGTYAFSIIDSGEVKSASDFKTISLMPGSTVRKLYQPAHGSWYPTEPSDKEWRPFNNDWSIFCVRIATTGKNKVDGYCVYDVHCSFRATAAALKERKPCSQPSSAILEGTSTNSLERRVEQLEQLLQKATLVLS